MRLCSIAERERILESEIDAESGESENFSMECDC